MNATPLGRYGEIVAALTALLLVAAALAAHLGLVPAADTTWLDGVSGLAIGVVLGQRATTNGAAKIALAAHKRLDQIAAPPAADGTN